MNKPKGLYLIVCTCGYPLYVRQAVNEYLREQAQEVQLDRDERLEAAYYDEGQEPNTAPYANDTIQTAFFKWTTSIRYTEDSSKIIGACSCCGHVFWITHDQKMGNMRDEWTQFAFDIHNPHDGGLMEHLDDTSPSLHVKHRQVPAVLLPERLETPDGFQEMQLTSKAKRRFAVAIRRALNMGLPASELPNWNKYATDKQFDDWRREIDSTVNKKGLIPA